MQRRSFCQRLAAGTGIVFGTTIAGVASAEDDIPFVSTRGHFYIDTDCGLFGLCGFSEHLKGGHTETDYDIPPESAPIPWDADDILIAIHGYNSDGPSDYLGMFKKTRDTYEAVGYDGEVVGFTWDSDASPSEILGIAYGDVEDIAQRNGKKLGQFLTDLGNRNPDATVRVVPHSMGTYVALESLSEVQGVIDHVAVLGAAVPRESVSMDGAYGPAIENSSLEFDNYHAHDDDILEDLYRIETGEDALGARGIKGPRPANYEEHDVTGEISSHYNWYDSERVARDVVWEWRESDADHGDGDHRRGGRRDGDGYGPRGDTVGRASGGRGRTGRDGNRRDGTGRKG